jgi:hypothetical protein
MQRSGDEKENEQPDFSLNVLLLRVKKQYDPQGKKRGKEKRMGKSPVTQPGFVGNAESKGYYVRIGQHRASRRQKECLPFSVSAFIKTTQRKCSKSMGED